MREMWKKKMNGNQCTCVVCPLSSSSHKTNCPVHAHLCTTSKSLVRVRIKKKKNGNGPVKLRGRVSHMLLVTQPSRVTPSHVQGTFSSLGMLQE